jgi:hypothetical protein
MAPKMPGPEWTDSGYRLSRDLNSVMSGDQDGHGNKTFDFNMLQISSHPKYSRGCQGYYSQHSLPDRHTHARYSTKHFTALSLTTYHNPARSGYSPFSHIIKLIFKELK